MPLTINLSDEQAKALRTKAAGEGLSLEAWLQRLAEPVEKPMQTAADIILSRMRNVRPEAVSTMPADGANRHDHYIYGWPKKEA